MAAGTIYWDGDTSTAWTTAGNWTVGTATAHTIPEVGDVVIFDGRPGQDFDATTVMAQGDTGGIVFAQIHFKAGHTGTVGAAGSPLHTGAAKIIIEGSGTYYIEASEADAVTDEVVPLVIVNNESATVYLTSNVNSGSWVAEFTQVWVIAGTVIIGNNGSANVATAVQTLRIDAQFNAANAATVTTTINCERTKATAYKMSVYMTNGTFTTDSAATLIDMADGTVNYGTDLDIAPETGMDITTLRLRGGTFNWYPDDSGDDAFIGELFQTGGLFDASASTNNNRTKLLGDSGGDIYLFRGASMNLNNKQGNIKIDSSSQFWNYGGTLNTDSSTQVELTYDA